MTKLLSFPFTVSVLSLHRGSAVHIEKTGTLSIGLGRVGVIDTSLTVKIMISGCSSTTESSMAMAGDYKQF